MAKAKTIVNIHEHIYGFILRPLIFNISNSAFVSHPFLGLIPFSMVHELTREIYGIQNARESICDTFKLQYGF